MYLYPLFCISFSFRSPQSTEYCSLSFRVVLVIYFIQSISSVYMSIPNAPAWWRKGSRSQLQLTPAVNVARINPSTRQTPPGNHSAEKKWILSLRQGPHLQKSRWQEGRRQRWEGGKIEAGRMGRTEGRFRKSRLLASPRSTSVIPLQEINKITPYGYDRMQMRSQRENTLIAAESQNPDEKLCGAVPPGAPCPAQPSASLCGLLQSFKPWGFPILATLRGFLVKCHQDKIRN